MVDGSIPTPLQIPTVTIEDLCNFHTRVFASPAPKHLFQSVENSHNENFHEEAFQVQDDDLGYYPDGAKRTLTDDQIAMFRHSEIYSILRERQVRQENLEAEGGEESASMDLQPGEAVKATALSDEEGEVRSDGEVKDVFSRVSNTTPESVEATRAKKKRKLGDTDTGYGHGKKYASRTVRGFVRELDSATVEDQTLDYGDEPPTTEKEDEVIEQDKESQARPVEGKRIWWPTIEAS